MMTLVHRIQRRIKGMLPPTAHGRNLQKDIRRLLPQEEFRMIFDVGANIGRTARAFAKKHPDADIHAFEPDPENFRIMKCAVDGLRVHAHNIGLSADDKNLRFDTLCQHDMRRIAADQSRISLPLVDLKKLDTFCREHGIGQLDYLKIDTEGHDLDVLKGSSDMLKRGAINFTEAECSTSRDNGFHAAFVDIHQFMEDHGYRLFGIYEQAHEWPTGHPNLRRVNATYISPTVIARNVKPCAF